MIILGLAPMYIGTQCLAVVDALQTCGELVESILKASGVKGLPAEPSINKEGSITWYSGQAGRAW